jgi:hypothetical protein
MLVAYREQKLIECHFKKVLLKVFEISGSHGCEDVIVVFWIVTRVLVCYVVYESFGRTYVSIFMLMQALPSSEMLVTTYKSIRRHNPEDNNR